MNNTEKVFIPGLVIKEHKFQSGDIMLKVGINKDPYQDNETFMQFIRNNWPKDEAGNYKPYFNLNIKKSQGGKWYAEQDTWQPDPNKKTETVTAEVIDNSPVMDDNDLPF